MNERAVDLFVEDKAHDELLRALLERLAQEEGKAASVNKIYNRL
jgi:hypothetical protein